MSAWRTATIAGAVAVFALPQRALAEVKLRTELSATKVEIGEQFTARLSISSDTPERLANPELKVPDGVRVFGQSIVQGSAVSITWSLMASRAGRFRIGPASVETSRGRVSDKPVSVEVVAQGSLGRRPPPLAGQPVDPFSILRGFGGRGFPSMPGFPGFPDEPLVAPELPTLPEGYAVPRALDPVAFLRATAEPRRVVVGEQLTLSAYAYAGRGDFGAAFFAEPSRDDFLAISMGDDEGSPKYPFDLDGRRWLVSKVATYALFPLKAGTLKIGSMSMGFAGPGYSHDPKGLLRKSAPLEIEVVEPPLQGRPPGYHLGDVGRYTLSAQVEPREVPAGGSVSVIAKLEGAGNLPFTLIVPERTGVHFLEPQLVEQITPRRGVVQGFRTFTYVVELSQPGELDLGEITLPYYDPKARAYAVARAALGRIKVTGNSPTAAAAVSARDALGKGSSLKGLVTPAERLGVEATRPARYWAERPGFWALLVGMPLSTLLAFVLTDLARALRRRRAERRGSVAAALDEAIAQLAQTSGLDAASVASAAERALFLAIEKATGLKARGVLKAQLAAALRDAGIDPELANRVAELLGRCDELRFAREAADAARLATEAREACVKLGQRKPTNAGANP